jgi:hypothetical protein
MSSAYVVVQRAILCGQNRALQSNHVAQTNSWRELDGQSRKRGIRGLKHCASHFNFAFPFTYARFLVLEASRRPTTTYRRIVQTRLSHVLVSLLYSPGCPRDAPRSFGCTIASDNASGRPSLAPCIFPQRHGEIDITAQARPNCRECVVDQRHALPRRRSRLEVYCSLTKNQIDKTTHQETNCVECTRGCRNVRAVAQRCCGIGTTKYWRLQCRSDVETYIQQPLISL